MVKGGGSDRRVVQTWESCVGMCPRKVDVRSLVGLDDRLMMCVGASG